MMAVACSGAYFAGSVFCSRYRPLICKNQASKFHFVKVTRQTIRHPPSVDRLIRYASTGTNGHARLPLADGSKDESFFLTMAKDVVWSLRSLAVFLAEQPSQLKYIEWPAFQNTLKTATLTLVLVALLIVALSTVDSALYYVLALLLRKNA